MREHILRQFDRLQFLLNVRDTEKIIPNKSGAFENLTWGGVYSLKDEELEELLSCASECYGEARMMFGYEEV